jgi:hypothetical protein
MVVGIIVNADIRMEIVKGDQDRCRGSDNPRKKKFVFSVYELAQ